MTQLQVLTPHVPEGAAVVCDNCDWRGAMDDLDMISDAEQRLTPGGTVPAGQCPDCGALAYVEEQPTVPATNGAGKPPEIVVDLDGGLVQQVRVDGKPITVAVRDYDVEGCEDDQIHTDENGREYLNCSS